MEKVISSYENTSTGKQTLAWGIVLGGLTSGLMDLVYASAQKAFSDRSVLSPWKGVASGLLGPAARDGGAGIALLGVVLHFTITFGAAVILSVIVWRLPWFAAYSGDVDRLFRPNVTGHSAGSAL